MPPTRTSPSQTLTDLLLDKVEAGLCLVGPDGTVVRANAEWLRSTGFDEESVVGENIIALFPQTRDMALAMYARARQGHHVEVPRHAQVLNGRETWWEGSIDPVPMEGGTGLLITAREVDPGVEAAAAQSQRTLAELVEFAPFGMYIVDSEFRIAYMNAGSRNGAFRNVRPLIGRPFDEAMHVLWPDAVAEEIIGHFRHTLESGEPYFSPRFFNPRADVEVVEAYEWELHRMTLPDHRSGVVCYYFDSTQIRAAEAELRHLTEALRESDRRKDEFLAMLSHELRNPLSSILNSSSVLRHAEPGSDQAQRARRVIERQTEHLTRLVDDLLDVSRIARGKLGLRRDRVDVTEIVRRTAEDFRRIIEDRGAALRIVIAGGSLWIDGDATRLRQLVGNLLHNAAKFTGRGGEVSVSVESDGRDAILRVRDTGIGIDAKVLPTIFDPFVQGERTLARTDGGLGLGLALVKSIAELHGGTVRGESGGKGMGSEFVVRIPAAGH